MAENTEVEYEYTCGDKTGFEYYVLGDDIRNEFNFLISTDRDAGIQGKLDEVLSILQDATDNINAFNFENGGSKVNDLIEVYNEIASDVSTAKGALNMLHSAIMKDIDNVNAELDTNFGYWLGRHLARKESTKKSN